MIDKIRGNEDVTVRSITNKSIQYTTSMTKSDSDTEEKISGIKTVKKFDFMFKCTTKYS